MPDSRVASLAASLTSFWPDPFRKSLVFSNLLAVVKDIDPRDWEVVFPGVHFHWLYRDGELGHAAAFIRFEPGARVPLHKHRGFEHILVLSGSQQDENGTLASGGLMVHAPGTQHSIVSVDGCLVLAIYEVTPCFLAPHSQDVSQASRQEVLLAVNGTLMRGLELNKNLLQAGAEFVRESTTRPDFRLWSIADRHPAMVRVSSGGVAVAVEIWAVPADRLSSILLNEPPGLSIGKVVLSDSTEVLGVLGEPVLCEGQKEISVHGGWRAYLQAQGRAA